MTSTSDAAPFRRSRVKSDKMADPSSGTKWWITVDVGKSEMGKWVSLTRKSEMMAVRIFCGEGRA